LRQKAINNAEAPAASSVHRQTERSQPVLLATETIDPDKLYPPKITAELLNMSTSWLAKARLRGDGPRYLKFGRSVKYQGLDLIEYRKSKKRHSTSEQ
jgi:hypothetical protein